MRQSRGVALIMFFGAGVLGLLVHGALAMRLGIGYAIPVTIAGAIAAGVALRGPLGHALARVLGGDAVELPPEQVLNELEELRSRLAEIEERTDFNERLLARQREEADGK